MPDAAQKPLRTYNPGDTVTYIATLDADSPNDARGRAYFERREGTDAGGLQSEIFLGDSKRVDARHIEISGTFGHVANGTYDAVRVDIYNDSASRMKSNPDPDKDSSFIVQSDQPHPLPNVTDFDPK